MTEAEILKDIESRVAKSTSKYWRVVQRADAVDMLIEYRKAVLLDEAIRECDRHALFLKYQLEHGGNYEHLKATQDEAEYLAGRIRARALAGGTDAEK